MSLSKSPGAAHRALLCSAFLCSAAAAQSADDPAFGPIVVTASRLPQPLAEALPHTTVLTRDDIERSQALDLSALLAREAGVEFARNGGPGGATSIYLRGVSSVQVLLLVDGMPLTRQDASGSLPVEHLLLDQVERIEVVRGNVSAVYGSGAVGGVVQIFTRRGEGPPSGGSSIEGGSHGTLRASASLRGRSGDTAYAFGVSGFRTRGISAIDVAQVPAANPDRDGYRNAALSASLSHDFGADHRVGALAWLSDGHNDYDNAFASPADAQSSSVRLSNWQLSSDDRLTERWQSRLSYSSLRDRQHNDETGDFGFSSDYVGRTQALQWVNTLEPAAGWRATAGLEHQRQNIDADDGFGDVYGRARSTDAVFAGVVADVGAQQWQLNLRRDRIGGTGSKTTGLVGWGHALGAGWALRATASTAFNAPPLGYLYAPFFGNAALQPERARSLEFGAAYAAAGQQVRATLFTSRVRDAFAYDLEASRFENIARTRNRGLEVSGHGRLDTVTGWRASLTAQEPKDEGTGALLLRRSRLLASLGVDRDVGAWQFGATARYAGVRGDVGAQRLGAYALLDATVQRALGGGFTVFGRIDNLGDARWQTAYGYPQPRRGAFIGLRYGGPL